jgi:membrane protease YdiL (CAAX protease family)
MELDSLRLLGPLALAVLAAWIFDRSCGARGLLPPGFVITPGDPKAVLAALRRVLALTALAGVFWVGVFAPLGVIGIPTEGPVDLETPQLFQLHMLFVLALLVWYVLGFAGSGLGTAWRAQFGLKARNVGRELAIGVAAGLGAWCSVLIVLVLVGSLIYALGGEEALPQQPPEMVAWVAALPLVVRLGISLSAGVVEELFFRGFLQPRVGIALSTGAFVLAHLSYEQPLMLVGISMLSLIFAFLVRWRQSIWAAIAAHTVFDSVQLAFVIPRLLDLLEPGASGAAPIG